MLFKNLSFTFYISVIIVSILLIKLNIPTNAWFCILIAILFSYYSYSQISNPQMYWNIANMNCHESFGDQIVSRFIEFPAFPEFSGSSLIYLTFGLHAINILKSSVKHRE